MLLKTLFWLLIACELAALGLFLLLGLAAAGPSRTHPLAVVAYIVIVPGLLLTAAIFLFLTTDSRIGRGAAWLIAASPLLVVVGTAATGEIQRRLYQDSDGAFTHFRSGPMREVETAISRNDAAGIAAAAGAANLNQTARDGSTVLVMALRHLEKNPGPPDVLRALLDAGADPNAASAELPLSVAIQISRHAGPEPVRLLLDAGADPNARSQFGEPAWFIATGITVDLEVLRMLLDRGAGLTQNWKAALLLLERGADWHTIRTLSGQDFRAMLESQAQTYGESADLAEVIRFLDK